MDGDQKREEEYRKRAINHRGYYSKIMFLALRLSHKKRIKMLFSLKSWGAAINQERPLLVRLRYVNFAYRKFM